MSGDRLERRFYDELPAATSSVSPKRSIDIKISDDLDGDDNVPKRLEQQKRKK
jgi:hypothetical protein